MRYSKEKLYWTIIFLIALTITGWLVWKSWCKQEKVLWKVPSENETIKGIQSGTKPGYLFIASESNSKWFLREIDSRRRVRLIASGNGKLQVPGCITHTDWQGNNLLLGLVTKTMDKPLNQTKYKPPERFPAEINIRNGGIKKINVLYGLTFNLVQPYSPDGKWLTLTDLLNREILVFNRKSGRSKVVIRDLHPLTKVVWSRDRTLYIYNAKTNHLILSKPPEFPIIEKLKIPTGVFGTVIPEWQQVLIVQKTGSNSNYYLNILSVNLRTTARHDLHYTWKYQSEPIVIDINHPIWSKYAIITVVGKNYVSPIIVEANGQCRQLSKLKRCLALSGIVAFTHGWIAFVSTDQHSMDSVIIRKIM